jgi:hypothetical protein
MPTLPIDHPKDRGEIPSISWLSLWSNDGIFPASSGRPLKLPRRCERRGAPRDYARGTIEQVGGLRGVVLAALHGLLRQAPCATVLARHADVDGLGLGVHGFW